MIARIKGWLRRREQQRRAAARYAFHQARIQGIRIDLAGTHRPRERAELLTNLATATQMLAEGHATVYGLDWIDAENHSMTLSLMWEAAMWRALAGVEDAAVYHMPRAQTVHQVEAVAADVLDRMVTATPADRARMLPELADVVRPVAGARAADAVAGLPFPAGAVTRR